MNRIKLLLLFTLISLQVFSQNNLFIPQKNLVYYPVALYSDSVFQIEDNTAGGYSFPEVIDVYPNYFFEKIIEVLKDSSRTFYKPIGDFSDYYTSGGHSEQLDYESLLRALGKDERSVYSPFDIDGSRKVIIDPDWHSVNELMFIEDWVLDSADNHFNKKVCAIEPVSYRIDDGGVYKQYPVADIKFDFTDDELKLLKEKAVLSKRVKYEFFFNYTELEAEKDVSTDMLYWKIRFENKTAPFLNSFTVNKLIDFLFDGANNSVFTPYDFYTLEPVLEENVWDIGKSEKNIQIEISPGEFESVDVITTMLRREIKSLIFIEDWYYSNEPFTIFKEVIGIAPVRHYNVDGLWRKEIPFVVFFDESKKF